MHQPESCLANDIDKLYFTDATGTAATAYSGSQTIHSDYTEPATGWDYTKGNGIITLHGETASRGTDYTSTTANWTLTGTNIAALDAHYDCIADLCVLSRQLQQKQL